VPTDNRGELAIGLMSGTSMDGVSAALVRFRGRTFRLLGYETTPYPRQIADALRRIDALRVGDLSRLNVLIGEAFAAAALRMMRRHRLTARQLGVIGSHGQTVYHGPHDRPPSTWQLGEPSMIAERTGVLVVADFRPRDVAAGGEGAPLVPYFDEYFYGSGPVTAFQNIGGIGNVTIVGRSLRCAVAFDTGPGNCLMDEVVRRTSRGQRAYDRDGALARQGSVDERLLRQLMRHPYFRRRPPKSTGVEEWSLAVVERALGVRWPERLPDRLATLARFTSLSIAEGLRRFAHAAVRRVVVSGGGARNPVLMRELMVCLHPTPVVSIEQASGLPLQAKEPVAFAFFAWRAIHGRINHLPVATGARGARVLGKIVLGGSVDNG